MGKDRSPEWTSNLPALSTEEYEKLSPLTPDGKKGSKADSFINQYFLNY